MKIGKYIFEIIPEGSYDISLNLPFHAQIIYSLKELNDNGWNEIQFKNCKHLKPGTGIRYNIEGLYWKILIIKQLN